MVPRLVLAFIFLIFFGCSKRSDVSLIEKAEKAYAEKKFKTAIELYQEFVRSNPNHERTPEILFKLAQIYLSDLRSPEISVRFFKEIYTKFPNSKEAMVALFMLGFIYANEIKDFTKAREYYQEFLKKYPDSELAISAKFELENLGKEPSEVFESHK